MTGRTLGPDLVSLIHHVELTKAGWRDRAIDGLLLASLLKAVKPLAVDQQCEAIAERTGVSLDLRNLYARLAHLASAGKLVQPHTDTYKIAETVLSDIRVQVADAERLEAHAERIFIDTLSRHGVRDADDHWFRFNTTFMGPLIDELGARTYGILAGDTLPLDRVMTAARDRAKRS